ncbi:MAG: SGNH/GDSL hydrolase family protein [Anaeromyxobacter sp.]
MPEQTVTLDGPEVKSFTWTGYAPPNYTDERFDWRWPDPSINLMPPVDTVVLGGPYHSIIPGSVVVTNAVTGQVYVRGVDYQLNEEWGQILNVKSRLGAYESGSLSVTYRTTLQRLDLLQVLPDGTVGVKRGVSAPVVPTLPSPDAGAVALAGVHLNTLDGAVATGFKVLDRDINMIRDVPPVAPINPGTIPKTLAKLRAGGSVNVAFFGDSITSGAEATDWLFDPSRTYTRLVADGLRSRYPTATVIETPAHQGSVSAALAETTFQTRVLDPHNAGHKVDLLVIALGMNDTGKPSTAAYKAKIRDYIARAKAVGMEVLLVPPIQSNPYFDAVHDTWVPREQIASALREVATQDNIAMADVFTEWMNQSAKGIAPVSQLHNWFNHPGTPGHKLYADTILRFFPNSEARNANHPSPPPVTTNGHAITG